MRYCSVSYSYLKFWWKSQVQFTLLFHEMFLKLKSLMTCIQIMLPPRILRKNFLYSQACFKVLFWKEKKRATSFSFDFSSSRVTSSVKVVTYCYLHSSSLAKALGNRKFVLFSLLRNVASSLSATCQKRILQGELLPLILTFRV